MRAAGGILISLGTACVVVAGTTAPVAATAAPSNGTDGLEYVALGDSYSAGFGLTPYSDTSPFAPGGGGENGCYQADADYPHRVATELGLVVDDRTCSGAISANLGYPAGTSLPVPPGGAVLPTLPTGSELQTTMNGQVAPALQTAALSASTDVVTFAIGGNDLGFTDIAEACMRLSNTPGSYATGLQVLLGVSVENCRDVFDSTNPAYADYQLTPRLEDFIAPRIDAVLAEIAAKAPNAQVFVVGYPQLATSDPTKAASCFSLTFPPPIEDAVPFSATDILYINEVQTQLDTAMAEGAAAYGFHYVSSWASTADHTLCDTDPWIQKLDMVLATGSPAACPPPPPTYLPLGMDGTTYACVQLGALHPTDAGVANLHQLVSSAIKDVYRLTVTGDATAGGTIDIGGGGFYPGESVQLVLNSTPVTLATVTASAGGAISATTTIPGDVPAGAHTLTATGQTSGHVLSLALSVQLAATGFDPLAPLLLGLCLLTTGFLLVVTRRRTETVAR